MDYSGGQAMTPTDAMVTIFIERLMKEAFGDEYSIANVTSILIEPRNIVFHLRPESGSLWSGEIHHPWEYVK